jgi:hypothetical protein
LPYPRRREVVYRRAGRLAFFFQAGAIRPGHGFLRSFADGTLEVWHQFERG